MEAKREWFENDYYSTLGVSSTADDKEIQRAYRRLAREFHPDTNHDPLAEDRFKEIGAAYEVIGDPETRSQYDQVRRMGAGSMRTGPMGGGSGNPFGGTGRGSFGFEGTDLSDLLSGMFGGGSPFTGGAPRPVRGRDQEAHLRLSFAEAIAGVTTSVTVSGGESDGTRSIKVRIPAGVEPGQRIRLRGKGGPGHEGGPPGDLFVVASVDEHPIFGREGKNLTLQLPVSFAEAALGADLKVPTFNAEPVTLRLPQGTQPGRTFRVKGRGIGDAGDLLVTIQIAVPHKLNKKQRAALEAFAEASSESPRPDLEV